MSDARITTLFETLLAEKGEREWLEFKDSYYEPKLIGEYLSALANSACLEGRNEGYLLFGVDDKTLEVVGTTFTPKKKTVGNQQLELWLNQQLSPKPGFTIREFSYHGKNIVLLTVNAAAGEPVCFEGKAYVRINSSKTALKNHPQLQRRIWTAGTKDWTAELPIGAEIQHLDTSALKQARVEYKIKHKNAVFYDEIDDWSTEAFLNKCGLAVDGQLTNAAIILLGKAESAHLIRPAIAQISWILKDADGLEVDYQHFEAPLLLQVDNVLAKIRNLNLRILPDGTLFPVEMTQYEPWVMREALHNCIAHQDYRMCSRVAVIEKNDSLLFVNSGVFLPGTVENVLHWDAPQRYYPNRLLTEAMVKLNMIDTIGSGIRRMFSLQKDRFLPMPDIDLTRPDEVKVFLGGRVLDERYTKLLMSDPNLSLDDVILLDRVQKNVEITKEQHKHLKQAGLVEGRYPCLQITAGLAKAPEQKIDYTRNKAFDDQYYKDLILNFLDHHGEAKPKEIQLLIMGKLSDLLDEKQRRNKVRNLIQELARAEQVVNVGRKGRGALWKRLS